MKTTKGTLAGLLLSSLTISVQAQDQAISYRTQPEESDTAIATRFALKFADSLVKAAKYEDWATYTKLSCRSAVKYYGGEEGFLDNEKLYHYRTEPTVEEPPVKLQVLTMMNDVDTWQCVIEKLRDTWIDGRKARVYTYLVGESTDNGLNWKFVDASHNRIGNVSLLLPSIFGDLPVPEGKTELE